METRLYVVIHPIEALIASQLSPEAFASHYKFGSFKHYEGKLIFAEIDNKYHSSYFDLKETLKEVVPHKDGRPKATKFVSTYRVLEHIELKAYKSMYLVNSDSTILELKKSKLDAPRTGDFIRLFIQIAPLTMLTLSRYNFKEFGVQLSKDKRKNAPVISYSQIEFDATAFVEALKSNPFLPSPIQGLHPEKLKRAIEEMKENKDKKTKGLSLAAHFDSISYKNLRHGIMISNNSETIEYKIPSISDIEKNNFKFFRAM